jgi:tight adherence protein B
MTGGEVTLALRIGAGALFTGALFVIARTIAATERYPGHEQIARYEAYLEQTRRLLFLTLPVRAVLLTQVAVVVLGLFTLALTKHAASLALVGAALVGPSLYLSLERSKRRRAFEMQIDPFLLALANSLKAVPSIGAALQGIVVVLQNPMRDEVKLVLNELRLGSTLDQSLLNAAARAKSQSFDAGVSALLMGRQVGGNLTKILDTTAASIREMNRLEGFLRSKTSESKAQLWVLALFPIGIVVVFKLISPGYFDPLQNTYLGRIVAGVAILIWLGAMLLARKLAQVDL